MKDFRLLIWLTQLGLSVAVPLGGFILLAAWLHKSVGWGSWVIWVGLLLGIVCAVDGLRTSFRAMERMRSDKKEKPPISFNDHD